MSLAERILADRHGAGLTDDTLVDLLMALVRVPSLTGDEGVLADALVQLLQATGWDDAAADERGNVAAYIRGSGGGRSVMLLTHTDTAPAGAMAAPYEPARLDGAAFGKAGEVVRGRGAVAPKAALAAMIAVGDRLLAGAARPAGDLVLAAVTRDLFANNDGVRDIEARGVTADWLVSGEPTENRAVIGARGIAQYEVTFTGVPTHAGDPGRGVNPISLMVAFLGEVGQIPPRPHPQLVGSTLSPLSVEARGDPPRTPASATAVLDYRPLPDDDPDETQRRLSAIAEAVAGRQPPATGQVRLLRSLAPFGVAPDDFVVRALLDAIREETGQVTEPGYIRFGTNAGYAVHRMGIPGVSFGPGSILDTGPDEHVAVSSLTEAARIYERLARRLLQGT